MKAKEKLERKAEKVAARQWAKAQEAERRAAKKAKKHSAVTGGGGGGGADDERHGSKKARTMADGPHHDLHDELLSDVYSTASTDATDAHPELGFANADGTMRVRKQRKHKTIQSPSSSSSSSSDGTITDISKDETVQPR